MTFHRSLAVHNKTCYKRINMQHWPRLIVCLCWFASAISAPPVFSSSISLQTYYLLECRLATFGLHFTHNVSDFKTVRPTCCFIQKKPAGSWLRHFCLFFSWGTQTCQCGGAFEVVPTMHAAGWLVNNSTRVVISEQCVPFLFRHCTYKWFRCARGMINLYLPPPSTHCQRFHLD